MKSDEQKNQLFVEDEISRRHFLKAGGVGVAAMAGVQTALADDRTKEKKLAMVIDLQHCTGCGGCAL
ncbi:MAG: twin-arginine translocation signal domain-containing protein, partial [Planctomycetota bacterium]